MTFGVAQNPTLFGNTIAQFEMPSPWTLLLSLHMLYSKGPPSGWERIRAMWYRSRSMSSCVLFVSKASSSWQLTPA